MHQRINHLVPFLSALLLAACANEGDTTGTRTLLHVADPNCANAEEICTASDPPTCYTVCVDEEPPECTSEEICTASYPPMCHSVCRSDGEECEGVGVTSSDGEEFFVCGTPDTGDAPPMSEDGSAGG